MTLGALTLVPCAARSAFVRAASGEGRRVSAGAEREPSGRGLMSPVRNASRASEN